MPLPCQRKLDLSTRESKGPGYESVSRKPTKDNEGNYCRGNDDPEMRQQKHDPNSAESSMKILEGWARGSTGRI